MNKTLILLMCFSSVSALAFGGGGGGGSNYNRYQTGVDSFGGHFGGNDQVEIDFSCTGANDFVQCVCNDSTKTYADGACVCKSGYKPSGKTCAFACGTPVEGCATYDENCLCSDCGVLTLQENAETGKKECVLPTPEFSGSLSGNSYYNCVQFTDGQCTQCESGYYVQNGTCVTSCENGRAPNENGVCTYCDLDTLEMCLEFKTNTCECTKCEVAYKLSGSTCIECAGEDCGCTEAKKDSPVENGSWVGISGLCTPKCNSGYVSNGTECESCTEKMDYCAASSGWMSKMCYTSTCRTCATELTEVQCTNCSKYAWDATAKNGKGECVCKEGMYLDGANGCVDCPSGTYKDVIGNQACTECPADLQNGACSATGISCDDGYRLDSGLCQPDIQV